MGNIYFQNWGGSMEQALLLHPALATSGIWRGVAKVLKADLSMTAIDLPGHGKSVDWDQNCDYHTQCTQAAAGFLKSPKHLIGHSFGATVALRLAVEQPEMIRSLTLIEPVLFASVRQTPDYDLHEIEFQPFIDLMQRGDREMAAQVFTQMWGSGEVWQDIPNAIRQYIVARIDLIVAGAGGINDDNSGVLNTGRLEGLDVPVLLLQGTQSPRVITAINDALADRLPNARQVRVNGAGHMLPVTHSQKVAQKIGNFISGSKLP